MRKPLQCTMGDGPMGLLTLKSQDYLNLAALKNASRTHVQRRAEDGTGCSTRTNTAVIPSCRDLRQLALRSRCHVLRDSCPLHAARPSRDQEVEVRKEGGV